jgi:hypothetical protein
MAYIKLYVPDEQVDELNSVSWYAALAYREGFSGGDLDSCVEEGRKRYLAAREYNRNNR